MHTLLIITQSSMSVFACVSVLMSICTEITVPQVVEIPFA